MVRCASGVTRIRQRAVAGPAAAAGVGKATPAAVMSWRIDLAQQVVADLADVAGLAAERRDAGDGIAGRAAGSLDAGAHGAVDRLGARLVDQRHRALVHRLGGEEGVVGLADHVDDGIADADDVELSGRHGTNVS